MQIKYKFAKSSLKYYTKISPEKMENGIIMNPNESMSGSLASERLSIRSLTMEDAEFLLDLLNTEGWLRFIGNRNINSRDDSESYIQKILNNSNINYWVVRIKKGNISIGIISLVKRDYLDHPDIGFAFLPSFANNGYAYEAGKVVLKSIFNNMKHSTILGITVAENVPSIKVLKKLGLQFQKEIEIENEKLQVFVLSNDNFQVSEITKSFFACFTNKNNSTPDLDLVNNISIPDILIANRKASGTTFYNLDSFLEPRKILLTDGTLIEFEEKEIYNETKIVDNKATRYSEYEKSGILNGKEFIQRGHKLFQFIKMDQEWKISMVVWEDNES